MLSAEASKPAARPGNTYVGWKKMSQVTPHVTRCCTSCGATFRSDFIRCPIDGGAVMVADCDPLIGSTLYPYEIDGLIGEGSMGRVYRAHDVRDPDQLCAVKVLYGDMASIATMRQRFAKEAEIASRLCHPNIVTVHDFGASERGLMFIAMELVEGRSLSTMIADGPMVADRVIRLARGICEGLAHAHQLGLIHRDLKPDNILVVDGPDGEVPRLVDFGIAISIDPRESRLTATGYTLGTPGYVAPEQTLTGVPVDHRADLYAFGVTLYEMLTGVLPFEGGMLDTILAKASNPAPAMAVRAPWARVPAVLEQVVQKLIERRAEDRYESIEHLMDALDEVQLSLSTDSIDTEQFDRFEAGELGVSKYEEEVTEVGGMPPRLDTALPPVIVESMPVITKQQAAVEPPEARPSMTSDDHLRTDLMLSRMPVRRRRMSPKLIAGTIGFLVAAAAAAIAWWWILPDVTPAPAAPIQKAAPAPEPQTAPAPVRAAAPTQPDDEAIEIAIKPEPEPAALAPTPPPAPEKPVQAVRPTTAPAPSRKHVRKHRADRGGDESTWPAPAPDEPAPTPPAAADRHDPDSPVESEAGKPVDLPAAPKTPPTPPPLPSN